jgi:porphyrinogen peroxidase
MMHVAQSGIFALGTGSHSYLEFDLYARADPLTLVQVMANLGEPRMTTGGVNLVVGFRPSLWAHVAPEEMPAEVTDFDQEVRGVNGYTMAATQHDLWVWVAGHAYHAVFDVTREAIAALIPVARLAAEVAGWTYKESRDLTGFIDGTENPPLSEAPEVALISDGSPGAGGSVVLVQQWIHDAAAFEALPLEEQEKVIGFSSDQLRLARMLDRMAGAEDGIRDALTRYTTAVSGAYYFVPSVEALRKFASEERRMN